MYLHEKNLWWQFRYNKETVMERLATVCLNQGKLIGRMSALGFSIRENAMLHNISETVVTVRVAVPDTDRTVTKTLLLTPRQKSIQPLLEDTFWKTAELPSNTKSPQ